jgi:hypothetical protein
MAVGSEPGGLFFLPGQVAEMLDGFRVCDAAQPSVSQS